jgi:hypothetical protein
VRRLPDDIDGTIGHDGRLQEQRGGDGKGHGKSVGAIRGLVKARFDLGENRTRLVASRGYAAECHPGWHEDDGTPDDDAFYLFVIQ